VFRGWEKRRVRIETGEEVEAVAPVIVSASRATDIPAFRADWFMQRQALSIFSSCCYQMQRVFFKFIAFDGTFGPLWKARLMQLSAVIIKTDLSYYGRSKG